MTRYPSRSTARGGARHGRASRAPPPARPRATHRETRDDQALRRTRGPSHRLCRVQTVRALRVRPRGQTRCPECPNRTADADAGRGVLSRGNLPQDAGPVAIRRNVRRRSQTQARVRGVAGVGPGDGDARGTSTVAGGRARRRRARRFIFQPRVHRAAVVAAGPSEFAGVSVAGCAQRIHARPFDDSDASRVERF